jgi:hypothetical protein
MKKSAQHSRNSQAAVLLYGSPFEKKYKRPSPQEGDVEIHPDAVFVTLEPGDRVTSIEEMAARLDHISTRILRLDREGWMLFPLGGGRYAVQPRSG